MKKDLINNKDMLDSFQKLSDFAEKNGFKLMETCWLGITEPHRFVHLKTHETYIGRPHHIFGKQGFPKEIKTNKDRFTQLAEFASANGFTLLDEKWKGSDVKHVFRHNETQTTHSWLSHQVMGSQVFPKELKSNEDRLKNLINFSLKMGFKVVNEVWLGSKTKHKFIHILSGGIYEATPVKVMGNSGFQNYMTSCPEKAEDNFSIDKDKTQGFKLLEQQWMASFLLLGSTYINVDLEESESQEMQLA